MKASGLHAVWRALADATRRQILDELRDGPRTTGDLCRPFRISRYAVMKHLGILERAKLVIVRRRGRERWNHLNAAPIQEIYERWVRPYASVLSGNILNLKGHVEGTQQGETMSALPKARAEFGVVEIELEIPIKANPSRVWQALVEETTQWWRKDFYTSANTKGFIIEPKLGGRAFEDCGDGSGQIWFAVIGIEPPKSLMLQGLLTSAFGGPAITLLSIELKEAGKTTILRLSDTIFGRVGDEKQKETRDGWMMLFDGGLRAYVESH